MFKYVSKKKNLWDFTLVPDMDHVDGMGIVCIRNCDGFQLTKVVREFKGKSIIKNMIEDFEKTEHTKPINVKKEVV